MIGSSNAFHPPRYILESIPKLSQFLHVNANPVIRYPDGQFILDVKFYGDHGSISMLECIIKRFLYTQEDISPLIAGNLNWLNNIRS